MLAFGRAEKVQPIPLREFDGLKNNEATGLLILKESPRREAKAQKAQ